MVAGPYFSQPDYDFGRRSSLYGEQEDDTKLYAISSAARKKSRRSVATRAWVVAAAADGTQFVQSQLDDARQR